MSVPGGSQGGVQNKSGISVAFISKSQKPRDRLKFEEISLEKVTGFSLLRRALILGRRAWVVGPVCKRSYAVLPGLKEMVLMYLRPGVPGLTKDASAPFGTG